MSDETKRLDELHKIIEPLYHASRGDYNQWSLKRDKKATYSYGEAFAAIKQYVKEHVIAHQSTERSNQS